MLSLLDSDLYKFTMQQAILDLFPNAKVEYKFKNRGHHRFTEKFFRELINQIELMKFTNLTNEEYSWLKDNIPFFRPAYLQFLKNYRFNPEEVKAWLDELDNLQISIKGPWYSAVLWEVPLMALISELYFKLVDTNWKDDLKEFRKKSAEKYRKLTENGCYFADFGTRRRRSLVVQNALVDEFKNQNLALGCNNFVGTSNVRLAMKYGIKPIGTIAHEFIQAMQALESLNHCNYYAMENWIRVYNTNLGIYLTDTITTDMFLKNFNRRFAMLYSGLRQDSGCPFEFTDKIVKAYQDLGIDPLYKTIVFSDSLDVEKAIKIKKYCENKIKCSFGIGTNFTGLVEESSPLNMVIKLWSVDNFPVVKLSDDKGKENGDKKAVNVMRWIIERHLSGNKLSN